MEGGSSYSDAKRHLTEAARVTSRTLPLSGGADIGEDDLDIEGAHVRALTRIGIGEDQRANRGHLTLTATASDLKRTLDDPTNRDGRFNATHAHYVWRYLADSPLLQAALVDGSQTSVGDITLLLVKARLYDHLRSFSCGFPTGTEWGVPVRAPIPRLFMVIEDVTPEWLVAVVTPRYLDEVLFTTRRSIMVGGGRGEWCLDDPEVAVVVLDISTGKSPLLSALQNVLACPYPLLEVDELFATTMLQGPRDVSLTGMRRNECCITAENFRRKFILVMDTKTPMQEICGVALPVTALCRYKEIRDAVAEEMLPLITALENDNE